MSLTLVAPLKLTRALPPASTYRFPIYAVPRRSLGEGGSLASPRLHCISAAPAALDCYPRSVAGHVAHPVRSILAPTLVTLPCTIGFFSKSSVAQRRCYSENAGVSGL